MTAKKKPSAADVATDMSSKEEHLQEVADEKAKHRPAPLNIEMVWAAVDDVIDALETGEYLRGDKRSVDAGKSWETAGYLAALRLARDELERGNAD